MPIIHTNTSVRPGSKQATDSDSDRQQLFLHNAVCRMAQGCLKLHSSLTAVYYRIIPYQFIKYFITISLFASRYGNSRDEWGNGLSKKGLHYRISRETNTGNIILSPPYIISASPYHYQPVFLLVQPLHIPGHLFEGNQHKSDYPIRLTIEILSSAPVIELDVMMVYDEVWVKRTAGNSYFRIVKCFGL